MPLEVLLHWKKTLECNAGPNERAGDGSGLCRTVRDAQRRVSRTRQPDETELVAKDLLGAGDIIDFDFNREPAILAQLAVIEFLHETPRVHDAHPVREVLNLVEEVARHENCHALF